MSVGARFRIAAIWVFALLLTDLMAGSGHAQAARSTRQMTALKPSLADRVARQDLLSVFEPVGEISSGMFLQLHGVGMTTRPYGTEFASLCQRDTLTIKYAPTDFEAKPSDQPIRPYGVETTAYFHAAGVPARLPEGPRQRGYAWNTSCGRLAGDTKIRWFRARNAEEAAKAVNVLQVAIDQVRAGTLKPISCELLTNEKGTCEQTILHQGVIGQIFEVEACSAQPGLECFVVDFGAGIVTTIVATPSAEGLTPLSVVSIKVEQYLIVT